MLKVAVPNKGTLSEPAAEMLREAGYRQRHESRDLTVLDLANDVEFFFLRPKDIAVYVGSGELDLGITGRDLAADSGAPVQELISLGFGYSTFRYAGPADQDWHVSDLAGKRIATSYPNLARNDLAAHGIAAQVIRLDGAVEISVQLGLADAIADVVDSGRSLRQHGLVAFGDVICASEAVLLTRMDARDLVGGQATEQPTAGCGFRPAVPDARLRLPGRAAGQGHHHHARPGVAHRRSAGRSRTGVRSGPWCGATRSTR